MNFRVEADSIGSLDVPIDAYYGVQSLRGMQNFLITGQHLHPMMIYSIACIKKAAAISNRDSGELEPKVAEAIIQACNEIMAGKLRDQFIVDPIQGGAGTSTNMNANEVIANRAIEILGGEKGNYSLVHPNDHVNMSQSTNDVYPSTGKLTALLLLEQLIPELESLRAALLDKAAEFSDVIKMGRTQLQDAVPIFLGQSFNAYACAVQRDIKKLNAAKDDLYLLNMGGTAIGTAVNASQEYLASIITNVQAVSGLPVILAEDLVDATQNLDCFVRVSGAVKACAVNLSKMANDMRLLSSGPKTGLGEIHLPEMQNGSSIMPGKVNPVIPEVVSQVAFHVIGNDTTITMAAEAGQLELNAFEPVLFYHLFESITTLSRAIETFTVNCIQGITANRERCRSLLSSSVCIATALVPRIGYKRAADIAKKSLHTNVSVREIVLEEGLFSAEELDDILDPVHMISNHPLKK